MGIIFTTHKLPCSACLQWHLCHLIMEETIVYWGSKKGIFLNRFRKTSTRWVKKVHFSVIGPWFGLIPCEIQVSEKGMIFKVVYTSGTIGEIPSAPSLVIHGRYKWHLTQIQWHWFAGLSHMNAYSKLFLIITLFAFEVSSGSFYRAQIWILLGYVWAWTKISRSGTTNW